MDSAGLDGDGRLRGPFGSSEEDRAARFIAGLVSAATGVSTEAIREVGRGTAGEAFARQIAMYLAHTRLRLGYTACGALFGRDRTTAAHAVRRIEDGREDPAMDTLLDCLERSVDLWPRSRGGAAEERR